MKARATDLGDEERTRTHPWRASQTFWGVQSGGREEYLRNSLLGDTHPLWFLHAFCSTGVGAESASQNLRPMSLRCQNWKEQ